MIEEFEDDVIDIYKNQNKASDIMQTLCVDTAHYCKPDDVTDHLMPTAQALLRGYEEATGHALDGFEGMFNFDLEPETDDSEVPVENITTKRKEEL